MSTLTEDGVIEVKTQACERLLAYGVEQKMKTGKIAKVTNRLHVAMPKKRDNKERPPYLPPTTRKRKEAKEVDAVPRKLERDLEVEMGLRKN